MITKIAASLGLVTTAVGAWVLTRGHAAQTVCNSYSSPSKGGVASKVCSKALSTYLIGVTLTTGGLIILALILFAMLKQSRSKEWSQMSFTVAGQPHRAIGTALASKPLVKTGS
jgi:hypothetical protein